MLQPLFKGTCKQRTDTNHWFPGLTKPSGKPVNDAITIVKQGRRAFWRHSRKDMKGDISKYICVKGKQNSCVFISDK